MTPTAKCQLKIKYVTRNLHYVLTARIESIRWGNKLPQDVHPMSYIYEWFTYLIPETEAIFLTSSSLKDLFYRFMSLLSVPIDWVWPAT